jgi:omega-6 fatty acid desaturase (delta-12 desaturase)
MHASKKKCNAVPYKKERKEPIISLTCLINMGKEQHKDRTWIEVISNYNQPDTLRSIWQIINSLVPYALLWVAMYYSLGISYLLTLALAFIAAGFLVRMFIIFHDCGHGSFFRNKKANRIVGTILGSLSFTPYDRWHKDHAIHHRTVGNLDKRGHGDVWTLTVSEYADLSGGQKFVYRLYRNPIVLFLIGPFFLFVIWFRFTRKGMEQAERRSVHISNLIILIYATGLILLLGWKAFLLIQLPVIYIASSAGVWLFYVQHQFEDVIWSRQEDWDYQRMALEGSSFLKFPRLLQWFSGNIGYHHIHHLSPMIPNYKLEACHKENQMFDGIKAINFTASIRTLSLRLWNEQAGKLVSFRQFKKLSPSPSL